VLEANRGGIRSTEAAPMALGLPIPAVDNQCSDNPCFGLGSSCRDDGRHLTCECGDGSVVPRFEDCGPKAEEDKGCQSIKFREAVTPLADIGNNGISSTEFPLGECEGDCDNNGECEVSANDLFCQ
jgi:hypothetical protein